MSATSPASNLPAVVCRGVTKEFGTGDAKVRALTGVDVEIPTGEMTLLVGPSGCGKTTLISIMAGLLDPTAGEVVLLGRNRRELRGGKLVNFRGKNIGFVFQQYNLLPALTAAENVAVPLIIAGVRRSKAVARAAEVLDLVGLGNKSRAYAHQLSGGQQQRVAIARALVHEPKLLVCDEPTAALDAQSGRRVMQLLREATVQPGRAVIVVTHDSRVYEFGDRIIEMSDGKVSGVRTREPLAAAL
ncbi:MAG: ABC transporter ATP-binding protein [Pirellulaceae bacterium]|nr:ABC transporter ATP-binding protein [Pirellulaceae bacterium]